MESGLKTFWQVGEALAAVRDGKLYRASHGTFEGYCREKWSLEKSRVYQLIESAEVASHLESSTTVEVLPKTERQVRPLAKLPPEQQREAWSDALESSGGTPTGKDALQAAALLFRDADFGEGGRGIAVLFRNRNRPSSLRAPILRRLLQNLPGPALRLMLS